MSTINGVTLEPSGTHILGADVFRGGIYRVNVATEAVERVYQHPFGVNVAHADSRGGIWFTQSTRNGPVHGERDLFRAVDVPTPDGALYYLPPATDGKARVAVQVADGLLAANGLALDEARGHLYVAETQGKRVLRYRLDTATGRATDPTTVFEGGGACHRAGMAGHHDGQAARDRLPASAFRGRVQDCAAMVGCRRSTYGSERLPDVRSNS